MTSEDGFEQAVIKPLSTFRKRWPVCGTPNHPQVIVWHFKTASRPLAKFEVTFHPTSDAELSEAAKKDGPDDDDTESTSSKSVISEALSAAWFAAKNAKTGPALPVHTKTNINCHDACSGEIVSHFSCPGSGFIELAWTNGFSPFQRQLSFRVSFAREDPLSLAEPGDTTLCNLATQVDFRTMETLQSLWDAYRNVAAHSAATAKEQCRKLIGALRKLKRKERRIFWLRHSGAMYERCQYPGEYFAKLSMSCETTDLPKSTTGLILRDVPRTVLPQYGTPKVLRRLESILRCYAVKHQRTFGNVGYAQGMNFILGTCLSAGLSDEQAFWLLSSVVSRVPLFNSRAMVGHEAEYEVLLQQVAKHFPDIVSHVHKLNGEKGSKIPDPVSSSWLWLRSLAMDIMTCCCSKSLPYADVAVVWDIMFLAGRVPCALGCVLAFLDTVKDQLLKSKDLGELMQALQQGVQAWKQQKFDQSTASATTLQKAPPPKPSRSTGTLVSIAYWVWRIDSNEVTQSLATILARSKQVLDEVQDKRRSLQQQITSFQKKKEADLRDFLSIPQGRKALIQEALLYRAYEEKTLLTFDVSLRVDSQGDLQNDVRAMVESMGTPAKAVGDSEADEDDEGPTLPTIEQAAASPSRLGISFMVDIPPTAYGYHGLSHSHIKSLAAGPPATAPVTATATLDSTGGVVGGVLPNLVPREWLVVDVLSNNCDGQPGPALVAGLQQGDYVVGVNGVEVRTFAEFQARIACEDSQVSLMVHRPKSKQRDYAGDLSQSSQEYFDFLKEHLLLSVASKARKMKRHSLRERFQEEDDGDGGRDSPAPNSGSEDLPLPDSPSKNRRQTSLVTGFSQRSTSTESSSDADGEKKREKIRKQDLQDVGGKVTDPDLRMQIVAQEQQRRVREREAVKKRCDMIRKALNQRFDTPEGRDIIRIEMCNMHMYYKKAKLIFHRRIEAVVVCDDSQNEAPTGTGHNNSPGTVSASDSEGNAGAGNAGNGSGSRIRRKDSGGIAGNGSDTQLQGRRRMSFKVDRGGGQTAETTAVVPNSVEGADYTLAGGSGGVKATAQTRGKSYRRETLYCEWYSLFPMYVSDHRAMMGNADFYRFLKKVGIRMSHEEAATIFYAIIHHGNKAAAEEASHEEGKGDGDRKTITTKPGGLQLRPKIGFLQFDKWFQEIITEHQQHLIELALPPDERVRVKRDKKANMSGNSAVNRDFENRVRALITNKAQREAAKKIITNFRKKDPPLLLFAIDDDDALDFDNDII